MPVVECNACGWAGEGFLDLMGEPGVLCPECGAYERHRAAVAYLGLVDLPGRSGRVLEVGNGLVQAFRLWAETRGRAYVSLDLWPGFARVRGNAHRLPFPDRSFDLVFCFHVLEHVESDRAALEELARVLDTPGLAVLQVPYDDTRFLTTENTVPANGAMAVRYYYDHRRDYGLDVLERCGACWGHVAEVHPLGPIPAESARRHGFARNHGTLFLCRHAPPAAVDPGLLPRDLGPMRRRDLTRRRAFEISMPRNGSRSPLGDWLAAEAELAGLSDDQTRELALGRWLRGRRNGVR